MENLKREDYLRVLSQYIELYKSQKADYQKFDLDFKNNYVQAELFSNAFEGHPKERISELNSRYIKEAQSALHNRDTLKYDIETTVQRYNRLLEVIIKRFGEIEEYGKLELGI